MIISIKCKMRNHECCSGRIEEYRQTYRRAYIPCGVVHRGITADDATDNFDAEFTESDKESGAHSARSNAQRDRVYHNFPEKLYGIT